MAVAMALPVAAQTTQPAKPAAPAAKPALDAKHAAQAKTLMANGVKFLLSQREKDGGWSLNGKGAAKPAATALVLAVLVKDPAYGPRHDVVKQGYKVLLSYQQKDGGIYDPSENWNNYCTALAVSALAAAGQPEYKEPMNKAVAYLKTLQIVPGMESPDGGKLGEDSPFVGGVNYGKPEQEGGPRRPGDLSNVAFWMQAMHDAGVDKEDEHVQRALKFLNRVQNRSESNPETFAAEGTNDGGFVYSPVESKGGDGPNGQGLRSYGSMTYAGFKSMLYAGVERDDPRVQAAFNWIRRYWTLENNPNLPTQQNQEGLYYYYHTFAKALRAWGQPVVRGRDGKDHNWREELITAIGARVQRDGSWDNAKDRWNEGSPVLVTAYVLAALQEATADAKNDENDATRQSLQRPIVVVDFQEAPLDKVLQWLSDVTDTTLIVDWKALEAADIAKDTPITLRLRNVKYETILKYVLEQAGGSVSLGYVVDDGVIRVRIATQDKRSANETTIRPARRTETRR